MAPLLSVVTAVFNAAEQIEAAVRSVAGQGCAVEHIVIDGGSTDGTVDLLRRLHGAGKIARWVSEADAGIADAFNKGIRMASGELIGLLNADDRYLPGALEKVSAVYLRTGPEVIIHGNMLREGNGKRKRVRPRPLPGLWKYVDSPFNHPATFVPKMVYEKVGLYDTRYQLAMDYDFYLRALRARVAFRHIDEDLVIFSAEGRSSADPLACHREVLRSQKEQGLSSLLCTGTWMAKVTVNLLKRLRRG